MVKPATSAKEVPWNNFEALAEMWQTFCEHKYILLSLAMLPKKVEIATCCSHGHTWMVLLPGYGCPEITYLSQQV